MKNDQRFPETGNPLVVQQEKGKEMRLKRMIRLGMVLALLSTVFVAMPMPAAVAGSATGLSGCTSGRVCVWKNSSFASGGHREDPGAANWNYYPDQWAYGCSVNCGMNDNASSIANTTGSPVKFYKRSGYVHLEITLAINTGADLYGLHYNNELSSHRD